MTIDTLKQAALDHLAERSAASFLEPLEDGKWLCVGTKESIARLVTPEGWKLVPIEPTAEMIDAAHDIAAIFVDKHGEERYVCNMVEIYDAMLAATPPQAKEAE